MPMSFAAFMAESQRRQRRYIATEQGLMVVLDGLRVRLMDQPQAYKLAAQQIGFHPLDGSEILDRLIELDGMEARVAETHGDTPGMRAVYAMQFGPELELEAA